MNWLRNAILEGMQGFMALRLDGAPPQDLLPATVSAWYAVLASRPISWDETEDKQRIREAFRNLAANTKRWPVPAQFMECLPERKPKLALTPPTNNKMPKEIRNQINAILAKSRITDTNH